jgi:hypothetical protein
MKDYKMKYRPTERDKNEMGASPADVTASRPNW